MKENYPQLYKLLDKFWMIDCTYRVGEARGVPAGTATKEGNDIRI